MIALLEIQSSFERLSSFITSFFFSSSSLFSTLVEINSLHSLIVMISVFEATVDFKEVRL